MSDDAIPFRLTRRADAFLGGPIDTPAIPQPIPDVVRLDIKEGDIIVLKFKEHLSKHQIENIGKEMRYALDQRGLGGNVTVITLDGGADLEVLSKVVPGGKWVKGDRRG